MVKPKKHLGQHFLHDEPCALRIVEALSERVSMPVVEVGPGTGVLTRHLLARYPLFKAWDVDAESIAYLNQHYPEHKDKFMLQDFLEVQIREPVMIVGNFPYNISSQLFFKIWESRKYVEEVVCMVQKEVAQRICAEHGNKTYGILSVLLQAAYDAQYLFTVMPGAFHPPPKVQSAVIRLVRKEEASLPVEDGPFKKVVKAAFGKRRKTLRNALKDLDLFENLPSDDPVLSLRAEQLSVQEFIELTKRMT
jgi:16S rRNA (adenine1518-N6/adenine1519-N6)-dimethyltransferase